MDNFISEVQKENSILKKEVTVGQLLTIAGSVIIALATGWITMNNRVSRLEARDLEREKQYEKIERKMDRIDELVTKIYVELQNKQDRPK